LLIVLLIELWKRHDPVRPTGLDLEGNDAAAFRRDATEQGEALSAETHGDHVQRSESDPGSN
jgi:hypothetical protein